MTTRRSGQRLIAPGASSLVLLDQFAPAGLRLRRDRPDDATGSVSRAAPGSSACRPRCSQTGGLRVLDQPQRPAGDRRARAPPTRRRRTRDLRSKNRTSSPAGSTPTLPGQSSAASRTTLLRWTSVMGLLARPPAPRTAADSSKSGQTGHQRKPLDTAPPRPLALAGRLHPSAQTHPSAVHPGPSNSQSPQTSNQRRHRQH